MEEQTEQHQKWWQKHKKLLIRTGLIALFVVVIVLIILIILGYIFNWDWTGLNANSKTQPPPNIIIYQPGKTLWDWLGLLGVLAIPVVVGFGAAWFSTQQGKATDRQTLDNQREKALQAYIDKMSELLLKEKFKEKLRSTSSEAVDVKNVAQVRTLTVLYQLDKRRIDYVLAFLRETGLIDIDNANGTSLLSGANLSKVNLSGVNLSKINLRGADLSGADLSGADLSRANFRKAKLGTTVALRT